MSFGSAFNELPPGRLAVVSAAADRDRRLGRAITYVASQSEVIADPMIKAKLASLLFAGQCLDFLARLRNLRDALSPQVARQFALLSGIGEFDLRTRVLPILKAADVVDFTVSGDELSGIDEFVGLTGNIIQQGMRILGRCGPSRVELAVLHSVELASWAPLTERDHLDELIGRGFSEPDAREATALASAIGANIHVHSAEINTNVIYNPNVWGAQMTSVASFLHKLGPNERGALLGVVEMASDRPGLALHQYSDFNAAILTSARRVGLVQSAEVRSSAVGAIPQTYVFSPLVESIDDSFASTEALHERKLLVAHMLYGHERARAGLGVVRDPRVLIKALLRNGEVGPASNITTDYHLLESRGIVSVRHGSGSRSFLQAVKPDVIKSGLDWLEAALDSNVEGGSANPVLLQSPSGWSSPERSRARLASVAGAAQEVSDSAVLELRSMIKEAQRVSRFDF